MGNVVGLIPKAVKEKPEKKDKNLKQTVEPEAAPEVAPVQQSETTEE